MTQAAGLAPMLATIVRGGAIDTAVVSAWDPADFCHEATHHGVLSIVADRLAPRDDLPAQLQAQLRAESRREALLELARHVELKRVLAALDAAGLGALVIKGAQLAYSHYPRPHFRPRVDTDLLIPEDARVTAHGLLTRLGYQLKGQMSGEFVSYQASYGKGPDDDIYRLDVHWRIANPQVFAGMLSYEELALQSVPVPALGSSARGLCGIHALLVACVHRVAHHPDSDHLMWLHDIHLIAGELTGDEWKAFASLAVERKVAQVCRHSLEASTDRFGTAVPDWVLASLETGGAQTGESSARYLLPHSPARAILDDLRAMSRWPDRWQLLREHLFPPRAYMRTVFAPSSRAPLPILHVKRLLRGGQKWWRG